MNLAEAKARLRATAAGAELSAFKSLESRDAIVVALVAGLLAGTPGSRNTLARVLVGVLFR